jgi:hypothetical protein
MKSGEPNLLTDSVPFEFSPGLGLLILGVGYGAQQGWKRWRNSGVKFDQD